MREPFVLLGFAAAPHTRSSSDQSSSCPSAGLLKVMKQAAELDALSVVGRLGVGLGRIEM